MHSFGAFWGVTASCGFVFRVAAFRGLCFVLQLLTGAVFRVAAFCRGCATLCFVLQLFRSETLEGVDLFFPPES